MDINKFSEGHIRALLWFQENVGSVFHDASWFDGADISQRLATRAKGIYKPGSSDHALSIRISDDGPYRDGTIDYRPDGSWSFIYDEESQVGKINADLFTNKALQRCINDQVPVGIFMKSATSSSTVEYEIAGLGIPVSYQAGKFVIEGPFSLSGTLGGLDSSEALDNGKKKVFREIVQRQGQGLFRKRILEAYDFRCAVTQYDARDAVEAAHIRPYSGPFSNEVSNGILLRADIHTLFDLREIGIHPGSFQIEISKDLKQTQYAGLEGAHIFLPNDPRSRPRPDFLEYAWREFESAAI
jgi:hypothetical protein